MSSQCVCHTDEWCFYCEMYSPLEKERNKLQTELEKANKEVERLRDDRNYYQLRATRLSGEHTAMKEALEKLDVYLDFSEEISDNESIGEFENASGINKAFRKAHSILSTLSQPKEEPE